MPRSDTQPSGFQVRAAAWDTVDLIIYDVIGEGWYGGIGAKAIAESLKDHKNAATINVFLNSSGGDVFDALAIYNTLARHKARVIVHVDGAALSAASIVAMAGDTIRMAENALLMIHDPWAIFAGTADELRAQADLMDKSKETLVNTYAARSGRDTAEISDWMTAESWFSAAEAVDAGLADEVVEAKKLAAFGRPAPIEFKNAPEALQTLLAVPAPEASGGTQMKETEPMNEKDLEQAKTEARSDALAESRKVLADLKAAFPDDAEFAMAAFEKGQTVVEAKAAYCDVLAAKSAQADEAHAKEVAALKAAGEKKAVAKAEGVKPLGGATGDGKTDAGDAATDWNALVEQKVAAGMPRQKAVLAANRERPDLREAYVAEYNAAHRRAG